VEVNHKVQHRNNDKHRKDQYCCTNYLPDQELGNKKTDKEAKNLQMSVFATSTGLYSNQLLTHADQILDMVTI